MKAVTHGLGFASLSFIRLCAQFAGQYLFARETHNPGACMTREMASHPRVKRMHAMADAVKYAAAH